MDKKIPTYFITVNPDFADGDVLGISQIAYTATPAIEIVGLAFDAVKQLRFTDTLRGIVAAPALQPGVPISRFDDEIGEYNVVFSEKDIELMVELFNRNIKSNQFNLDHNKELSAPSFVLQNWIVENPETDISFTKYGVKGLKKGSWFVVSKFDDLEYFKLEIVEKGRNGLSVEGLFALALQQIKENNYNKLKQNENMKQKFMMADGEYLLANGDTLLVKDGVAEIIPAVVAEEVLEEKEEVKEEELVEDVIVGEAPVAEAPIAEPAPVNSTDEAAILAVIQPKLDEILAIIAELKTQVENKDVVEESVVSGEEMKITKAESLNAYFNSTSKRK